MIIQMYSLGIIFFEMCYHLETGMQRHQMLSNLRAKDHTLPAEFQKGEKVLQGTVIEMLIQHQPSGRPTAAELLKSGKIPLQIQDETIRDALRHIWDPNSPHSHQLVSALFSRPPERDHDVFWDLEPEVKNESTDLLTQLLIKDKLVALFRRHGAMETTRPTIVPRSTYYSENVTALMDVSGKLLQLPYDLTLPHARMLAKRPSPAEKTFAFGDVYRGQHTGSQPKGIAEVDFDIVSRNDVDLALKDAEVIGTLNEILDTFPAFSRVEMYFHINHANLLDIIMEFCRIEVSQRPRVLEVLSFLTTLPWSKISNKLRAASVGISSTSVDALSRFDFKGTQLFASFSDTQY